MKQWRLFPSRLITQKIHIIDKPFPYQALSLTRPSFFSAWGASMPGEYYLTLSILMRRIWVQLALNHLKLKILFTPTLFIVYTHFSLYTHLSISNYH